MRQKCWCGSCKNCRDRRRRSGEYLEPLKSGPKVKCECGKCQRCKWRMKRQKAIQRKKEAIAI